MQLLDILTGVPGPSHRGLTVVRRWLALTSLVALAACGGGQGDPAVATPPVQSPPVELPSAETPPTLPPPAETPPVETPPVEPLPVQISISPATTTLEPGESVTLTVTALNTQIVWPGTVDGSYVPNGNTVTYTPPPTAGSYEFTVAAQGDPSLRATAKVELVVPPAPQITAFTLQGLAPGTIDQATGLIRFSASEWIPDLQQLKAVFTAVGTVTVEGVVQTSGTTPNDFYRDVRYTVSSGKTAKRTYTVQIESPQTTGLPVIRIDTKDNQPIVSKETYLRTNITVVDPQNSRNNLEHLDYKDEVRGRGNSTWLKPKKPYRIKFDKKTPMMGLTEAKSWVLLANYQDPTLLANSVAFELGQRFGLPYTPHYVPVELFVNGSYEGSYLLTEQIQVGKGRVDIDPTAGFLVEADYYYDEEPKFTTQGYQVPIMIKSPEDLADPSGYDFVKNAFAALEAAMLDATFPESGYRELLRFDAVIDFLMINEVVKNVELQWPKSLYMYRDAAGGIGMGPLWDFDWGYGYSGGGFSYFTSYVGSTPKHAFLRRFYDDPVFIARYKARWNAMYPQLQGMPAVIQQMADRLQKSQAQNFRRWPEAQNNGYEREISDLRTWWQNRVQHLNTSVANM